MTDKCAYDNLWSHSDKAPWKKTTMKQKALWTFALIFWLVAACTIFAVKTQEVMTPQVYHNPGRDQLQLREPGEAAP